MEPTFEYDPQWGVVVVRYRGREIASYETPPAEVVVSWGDAGDGPDLARSFPTIAAAEAWISSHVEEIATHTITA
jgi:hypothetical protein